MSELTGKIIAKRYRVDAIVGRGGMGDVYKAWDSQRAVFLAMKVLHADMAEDKIFLRRFEREADTLSQLQHPHIVRFYGLEQDKGLTFMLMDYVEGTTLRKMIFEARGPISPKATLQIVRPICSALHYAHQMGRVHCDIKPANIMLRSNGDVLVADFGIARMMEASTTTTMARAGTPAYMAPEQVLGKRPSPQTDLYALGIVLYEMLTGGQRPFTGEMAKIEGSTSEKVRWEQTLLKPPSPRKYAPEMSREMESVILKCLEKEPAKRYSSALDLLQALTAVPGSTETIQSLNLEMPQTAAAMDEKPEPPLQKKISKPENVQPKNEKVEPEQIRTESSGMGAAWAWIPVVLILACVFVFGLSGLAWNKWAASAPETATATAAKAALNVKAETAMPFPPTLTLIPVLPTKTKTPVFTPTVTSLPGEMTDAKGIRMNLISAGTFKMGSEKYDSEKPVHEVYLDAYYMDIYEVTNTAYKACVEDGKCRLPGSTHEYRHPGYAQYPVVYVNWDMAKTFCEWRGPSTGSGQARLPTEAEWEKAARGTDGRKYPWGETISCDNANYLGCVGSAATVGSYESGKSPYGLYDMAGNVWEWVMDWYSDTYYHNSPSSNPLGPDSGAYRTARGGSWGLYDYSVRSTYRNGYNPTNTGNFVGFRCARSP